MTNHKSTAIVFSIIVLSAIVLLFIAPGIFERQPAQNSDSVSTLGACPPYYLLTEQGDTINPITGKNIDKPYSSKQTCGKCHDYDKITQGFHFQQGKDEQATEMQSERVQWATSPGNYGGTWCSPSPLYSYLSEKDNTNEKLIDLTSYTFINKCGACHPGGGPLEFDRNQMRYDQAMADTSNGFTEGGLNNLDGDYYKAKWTASGVIEADCYLCHMPSYDNAGRVAQIQKLNYRYAALEGSGFGTVSGSVAEKQAVTLEYHKELFNPDGSVTPHIIKEPRNETCLLCHAKPSYKKRGADFTTRSDVHLRAGLKCVDCHPAGSMAVDERIKGKEVHQFGKGDDPGGMVRSDLDNTMRTCNNCHDNGYLGAPIANHPGLPSLHLDKISCQACHIPERNVKSAHFVAGDVFNPGTRIPTKGKYLWTFYGPDMAYWNHYGDLEMMGYADKPTHTFKPEMGRYKGIIYPVNRVHNSWPGILEEGKQGLMQPKMSDVYKMWASHKKDALQYPELSKILDDSGDHVPEINRPDEIDALIASITQVLNDIKYPMEGKQVVWVMNNRIYKSGRNYAEIPMEEWEASPYANVHKYNHDIKPAKSALGTKGCTECHSFNSDMFYAQVLKYPVGDNGQPVYEPQYAKLGINAAFVWLSAFREQYAKTLLYPLFLLLLMTLMVEIIVFANNQRSYFVLNKKILLIGYLTVLFGFLLVWIKPDVHTYVMPNRIWFDKGHFTITASAIALGVWTLFSSRKMKQENAQFFRIQSVLIIVAILSGSIMMIKFDAIESIVRIAFTLFDIAVIGTIALTIYYLLKRQFGHFKLTDKKSHS